jgi:AraC-like DNA-binding protein
MVNSKILPKLELKRVVRKFIQDKDRGISLNLFCEIVGISSQHLKDVFLHETEPLTEYMQRRVNKAYYAWQHGEIAIMQNRDSTKFVQYRKEAKPVLERTH